MATEDVDKYFKARRKAYDANNLAEAASICNNIGVYYSEKGDYDRALRYHREELQLSESLKDVLGQAVGHRKVGECLADLCKFSEAIEEQKRYLELAKSLSNLQEVQRAYATLGRIWYMRHKAEEKSASSGYLRKAKESFNSSLGMCNQLESLGGVVSHKELSDMRARLYLNLGLLAEETGEKPLAEDHYRKACQIGKESGINPLLWQCHYNLGELLLQSGQPNRALIVFEESLNYANRTTLQNKALSLLQMAEIYADMSEWRSAKKHLKTCIKLNSLADDTHQAAVLKYRAVCKILVLLNEVESCSDHLMKIQLLERLGDMCCRKGVAFYSPALKFYELELDLAECHGLEPEKICSVLFSLAETHNDRGEYQQALDYYRKELLVWGEGHPSEAAGTWANMARVHESAGEEWTVVIETYMNAIKLAKEATDVKMTANVYQWVISYLDHHPKASRELSSLKSDLKKLQESHPELLSEQTDSTSEEEPLDSQDPLTGELVLSCTSSENEEEDVLITSKDSASTRQLRGVALRKKSRLSKRNEKGETLLHVAAIEGNLARVKQLLNEGAETNTRDHCGWTPLHEACNHGYIDIVCCLVEHGANINDPGGAHCHKTTPLMDSAVNGHVNIVSYLVNHGANLAMKNDKGETALDLITKSLADNEGSSSHRYELLEEHSTIKSILSKEMRAQGLITTGPASFRAPGDHQPSSTPVAIVHPLPSSVQDDYPALISINDDSNEWEESEDSRDLLSDNWLIDDMAPPKKRKRSSLETSSTTSSRRRSVEAGVKRKKPTLSMDKAPSVLDDDDIFVEDVVTVDSEDISHGNDESVSMPSTRESFSVNTHFVSNVIRLKVQIEGLMYLVPCNRYHGNMPLTVASLIDKVSERYLLQNGRRPVVTLTTNEGALLCPTDNIMDVVEEGEVLVGVVSHWDTLPLNEHYRSVCEKFKTVPNDRVTRIFQSNVNPTLLDLSNTGLRPADSPTLFQSLLPHTSLTSLILSGNCLKDPSMNPHLSSLLRKLPSLHTISLKCTGLTECGLSMLSQGLTSASPASSLALRNLILSHNSLGPSCGSALSLILSLCPSLLLLDLTDTGLSSYTFEAHSGLLEACRSLQRLQELFLSRNAIGHDGLDLIIPVIQSLASLQTFDVGYNSLSLPAHNSFRQLLLKCSIRKLVLSGSCCIGGIEKFLESHEMPDLQLQELCLSRTELTCQSMLNLAGFFSCCKCLFHVDISGNPLLGNDGVMKMLSYCSPMELLLQNCGLKSPLHAQVFSVEKRTHVDLSDNPEISSLDKQRILSHWTIERTLYWQNNIFIIGEKK